MFNMLCYRCTLYILSLASNNNYVVSIYLYLFTFFPSESWPVASYPLVPEACKLKILMACRHHIMGLKCPLQEESLSSLQLSFPGQFVQVQYVIGLVSDGIQELLECRLEPTGNGNAQFKVVHVRHSNFLSSADLTLSLQQAHYVLVRL